MAVNPFGRWFHDRVGNVAIIFALCLLPIMFAIGAGVDYGLAAERQQKLNAAADAAALAAITPAMMAQPDAASAQTATAAFNAQATVIDGVNYIPTAVTATVADNATVRTITVTYAASSQNVFLPIFGISTIALGGHSQGSSQIAPNIDFYLLLDSSPSMAIAATQNGINAMVSNTSKQGGCAFGCHESNPAPDNLGNPGGEDNYALARSLGVTLRIDVLRQAVQNLMNAAPQAAIGNHATYRAAIYGFDAGFQMIETLTSNFPLAATSASSLQMLEVYDNNWLTSTHNNNDTDTNYDLAMSNMNVLMPNPGLGSNAAGDTPQEVLFFVTDGVEDEMVSGSRQMSVMNNGWCTTIKNRGIRIAVLYTDYLPLPTNAFYNSHIASFQPNIGSNLQSCASPGLYQQVSTGGDISAALSNLFAQAVHTAHLTQ